MTLGEFYLRSLARMNRTFGPGQGTRAFVAWTVRHGSWLWLAAVLLAIPATIRTVSLYRHLKSDVEELLPRESPSVRALDEMRARIPGLQYLGVVVDVDRPENIAAGERFLDDLAARIRNYPREMVREVRTGDAAERKFVEDHAPLYVDLDDLKDILRRIEARRDYEVERESGSLLDDSEPPPSIDVSDIEKKYDQRQSREKGATSGHGRFSDAAQHLTLLFVEAGEFTTGAEQARALMSRVQSDVRALGGPGRYAPGMRVGFSSDVAISVEELDALEADLSVSSILVGVAEIAIIVLYYKWWRSTLVLFPPLLLATVYAFGIASLPPFHVTSLNSNTAFLGSIIVGNGINVGIVLLARYREARRAGASVDEALAVGIGARALGRSRQPSRPRRPTHRSSSPSFVGSDSSVTSDARGCWPRGRPRSFSCRRSSSGLTGAARRWRCRTDRRGWGSWGTLPRGWSDGPCPSSRPRWS